MLPEFYLQDRSIHIKKKFEKYNIFEDPTSVSKLLEGQIIAHIIEYYKSMPIPEPDEFHRIFHKYFVDECLVKFWIFTEFLKQNQTNKRKNYYLYNDGPKPLAEHLGFTNIDGFLLAICLKASEVKMRPALDTSRPYFLANQPKRIPTHVHSWMGYYIRFRFDVFKKLEENDHIKLSQLQTS